eukprot:m.243810 g.243810  ORF g.243810 m.243810 type:complete len:502 (+) comp40240_c0_seq1:225-1730(+)
MDRQTASGHHASATTNSGHPSSLYARSISLPAISQYGAFPHQLASEVAPEATSRRSSATNFDGGYWSAAASLSSLAAAGRAHEVRNDRKRRFEGSANAEEGAGVGGLASEYVPLSPFPSFFSDATYLSRPLSMPTYLPAVGGLFPRAPVPSNAAAPSGLPTDGHTPAFCLGQSDFQTNGVITVRLHKPELWRKFYKNGTEMMITKKGRRFFPYADFVVNGLDHAAVYRIKLELFPVDGVRYRYDGTQWVSVEGEANQSEPSNVISAEHPESPNTGKHWMKNVVSFRKAKVTNFEGSKGQLVLKSMYKYGMRVIITKRLVKTAGPDGKNVEDIAVFSESFPLCEFIAVTAYKSNKITQTKIEENPFAKAFRHAPGKVSKRAFPDCQNDTDSEHGGFPSERSSAMPRDSKLVTFPLHHTPQPWLPRPIPSFQMRPGLGTPPIQAQPGHGIYSTGYPLPYYPGQPQFQHPKIAAATRGAIRPSGLSCLQQSSRSAFMAPAEDEE